MVNSNRSGHPDGVGVLASATAFTVSKKPFQFPVREKGGFFGDGEGLVVIRVWNATIFNLCVE